MSQSKNLYYLINKECTLFKENLWLIARLLLCGSFSYYQSVVSFTKKNTQRIKKIFMPRSESCFNYLIFGIISANLVPNNKYVLNPKGYK